MADTDTEKFLSDLAGSLTCAATVFVGGLAFVGGSMFFLIEALNGATGSGLILLGAIACVGIVSCAGAILLDWKPPNETEGPERGAARETRE